ncbi:MAG: 50S ribosomal protein L24 [candidate division TM6 bacterium GW2011_GWE2_41_16]|nr:MAG: 50S ribosomal protein L24 [candidate division TM6 bacterium GW2011_GWE2_41_16]
MFRIKKNDTVQVMRGSDKGKVGVVIALLLKKGKVKVQGVAIKTHHVKARSQGEQSTIRKEEAFIDLSNVMPICPSTKKPCRVRIKTLQSGENVRISSKTNEAF